METWLFFSISVFTLTAVIYIIVQLRKIRQLFTQFAIPVVSLSELEPETQFYVLADPGHKFVWGDYMTLVSFVESGKMAILSSGERIGSLPDGVPYKVPPRQKGVILPYVQKR